MNCPGCGRFMHLNYALSELESSAETAGYWWECGNEECPQAPTPIPASEYDWLYWCWDIPAEDLAEDPELAAECAEMKRRYDNRRSSSRMAM